MIKMNDKPKMLMIQPRAGLGNRLNGIYSGLYLRDKYKVKLHLLWQRDDGCNVPFEELFQIPKDTDVRTIYYLGYKNRYALKTICSQIYLKIIKMTCEYLDHDASMDIYNNYGQKAIEDKICTSGKICFNAFAPICDNESLELVRNELVPTREISNRVDEIMNPYKGKKVVGIHIRRTDHKYSIDNSPLEKFIEYMDLQPDDTYFYLATDDRNIQEELSAKYKVIPHISFSDSVTRDSVNGMKDAYVEMLCLSRCDEIFGSYRSTFSMMAAFIGDKELRFAGDESGNVYRGFVK